MTMDPHDSRDLDGVIDGVARAMTATELAHDLRPAVASRIADGPPWTIGWRAGLAAAAIIAVVVAAVVLRPLPSTPIERVAEVTAPGPRTPAAPVVATREEAAAPRVVREARVAVRRQVVVESAEANAQSIVEVEPLASIPLTEERAAVPTQARIEIAPIDVAPVRIRELGEAAE